MPAPSTSLWVDPISGQTVLEERINTAIHGLGLLLGIGGVSVLLSLAGIHGTAWHVVSFSVYGATLIILFGASVLYHGARRIGPKRVFQVVDHAAVFLLIAGTYTPFTLVPLNGGWGWSLFGVIWGLAAVGIALKVAFGDRYNVLYTLVCLGMGWLVVIAAVPLWNNLAPAGTAWLVAGGLAYSLGAAFYLWERLPFSHTVWHLLVVIGAGCHFLAILFHVLPLAV